HHSALRLNRQVNLTEFVVSPRHDRAVVLQSQAVSAREETSLGQHAEQTSRRNRDHAALRLDRHRGLASHVSSPRNDRPIVLQGQRVESPLGNEYQPARSAGDVTFNVTDLRLAKVVTPPSDARAVALQGHGAASARRNRYPVAL